MAEMGAHSALSGAIAISVYQSSLSLEVETGIVIIASSIGHFVLDLFPHGHTKKMWKELISGAIIFPTVLVLSFLRGGIGLLFLSCIALFFGNIFDVLLELSNRFKKKLSGLTKKIAQGIIKFNLLLHWFVRSKTFMVKYNIRQRNLPRIYKGRKVYSWNYGWYNLIPLVISLLALYWSFVL